MINIIPQTEVRLLKTPLEQDSQHTLSWNNLNEQTVYFLSKTIKSYNEFTYQRETQSLVVPDNYDNIYNCNYLMYKNNGFNSKYFYAFITKMEYVSENSTRITFEIDSIQTWYFNINYNQTFIEREHVNDDGFGKNTIPEGLETGEYVEAGIDTYAPLLDTCPVMASTIDPKDLNASSSMYASKYEAVGYYIFKYFEETEYDPELQDTCLDHVINSTFAGKNDAIATIFMAPRELAGWDANSPGGGASEWFNVADSGTIHFTYVGWSKRNQYGVLITDQVNPKEMSSFNFNKKTTIGTYTPRNKKLLAYPYCYFTLTNNNGGNVVYHYEDFSYASNSNQISFGVRGTICPGCAIRAFPKDYKNISGENYTTGLSAPKFPICSWQNDIYTNWLTQNGVNYAISGVANAGSIIGGVASTIAGNPVMGGGMIVSGVSGVINDMKEIYQHSLIPPQAEGDLGSGETSFACKNNTFQAHHFRVKEEFARIIDSYFDLYGYKVNALKTPNITGRRNWNYVKTVNCNFTGDMPQEDLEKIKNIFNNGITFWHNANNFLNYSVNNDII